MYQVRTCASIRFRIKLYLFTEFYNNHNYNKILEHQKIKINILFDNTVALQLAQFNLVFGFNF